MAQKDYVKRGRSSAKSAPPPKPPLPWLRIVITAILLFGFIYFLWSISTGQPDEEAGAAEPKVEQQAVPKPVPKALPILPEDTYSYPETLEENTVEIDRKEQEKSEKPYLMQCGSFRQQQQAEAMRANLALQGLEAQVRASTGKNGLWYRVILGPYDYKRDAETDRHVIQRVGIGSCQIWYWNL